MTEVEKVFHFKSRFSYYQKEKAGLKTNTVREIDLDDDRFTQLIYWMWNGFNKGDIKIHITEGSNHRVFFERDIRDITIWEDLMIITWDEK